VSGRSAAAYGFDTGAWVAPTTPPSWLASIRRTRTVVRPGVAVPFTAVVVAAALLAGVAGHGTTRLDAAWSVLAGVAGLTGMALALAGLPLPGGAALLAAVACWGFVTRSLVPESLVPDSFGELGGVAAFVAGNLAFAVPLVAGFVAAGWTDGRRVASAGVRAAVGARRWFGVNRGEPEPQLPALEQIPAARFFALPGGRCSHLVTAGRRVALVGATVWPRGEYSVVGNEIARNGRAFRPGTDDVDGVVDDLRAWAERLGPAGATCRAFLVVHQASERLTDTVRLAVPVIGGVQVVTAADFVEAAGAFFAAEPNTLSIPVLEPLLEQYAS